MVDLARYVAKMEIPSYRRHLDLMVACEDEEDNDFDIPQLYTSVKPTCPHLHSKSGNN